MVIGQVYFPGAKTEGMQLFKIFDRIGSFNEEEYNYYKKLTSKSLDWVQKANLADSIFERLPVIETNYEKLREEFQTSNPEFEDLDNLIDLLMKMFQYIPAQRITAKEALNHRFFNDIRCLRFEEKRMYLGILLFLLPPMSLQCGISTHTEIGYRCPLCDLPCLAIA